MAVGGGREGRGRVEHLADGGGELFTKAQSVGLYIIDALVAEAEDGVVAFGSCMLNEEECRTDWQLSGIKFCRGAHDATVEEGLQVVVAVLGQALLCEYVIDGIERGEPLAASLVVDDTDALGVLLCSLTNLIQTVYASADG